MALNRIYTIAHRLGPCMALWPGLLAASHTRRMHSLPRGSEGRREAAVEALRWLQKRDELLDSRGIGGDEDRDTGKYLHLRRLGMMAFVGDEASDHRAEEWAGEAAQIPLAAARVNSVPHPAEVYELHLAHVVLGKKALQRRHPEEAERQLALAGLALSPRD
jgi:hypothetical protein